MKTDKKKRSESVASCWAELNWAELSWTEVRETDMIFVMLFLSSSAFHSAKAATPVLTFIINALNKLILLLNFYLFIGRCYTIFFIYLLLKYSILKLILKIFDIFVKNNSRDSIIIFASFKKPYLSTCDFFNKDKIY